MADSRIFIDEQASNHLGCNNDRLDYGIPLIVQDHIHEYENERRGW